MNFSTREDIEAPIEFVFDALSDFEGFERAALRRGAEVVRTDRQARIGPGMSWRAQFPLRGKARRVNIALERYERPGLIRFDGMSKSMEGDLTVELLDLSPRRTRMAVKLDLRPMTLTARIMLQSLRLAKAKVSYRFSNGVHEHARAIEGRYRRGIG